MIAKQIYEKFRIPPNLQEHCLRVTALADYIANHWKDNSINRETLLKATLLHDLGNIIKFNFSRPDLWGAEANNLDYWKKVQEEMIQRYGPDEHLATEAMCKGIGVDEKVYYVVTHVGFSKLEEIAKSSNWEVKVCTYSDHRTSPTGVTTLKERYGEASKRYAQSHTKGSITSDRAPLLFAKGFEVEKQIQLKVNIDLNKIDGDEVEKHKKRFLDFSVV